METALLHEVNNFKTIAHNWEYVLPPSRPSFLELQRIQSLLLGLNRNSDIAILGSTAEYRDLLKEQGFSKIYVLDKNKDFYDISKNWCAHDTSYEKLIEGDWLDTLGGYRNCFDVVLSDLTMGNIDYTLRDEFYGLVSQSLRSGGFFVDKVLTNELPLIPLSCICDKYLQLPLNLSTANRFSCEALFCSELLSNEQIDTTVFYDILRERFSNYPKLLKLIEMSLLITPENCMWYYGKHWNTIERTYIGFYQESPHYIEVPESPYYGRLRHYFHKKG